MDHSCLPLSEWVNCLSGRSLGLVPGAQWVLGNCQFPLFQLDAEPQPPSCLELRWFLVSPTEPPGKPEQRNLAFLLRGFLRPLGWSAPLSDFTVEKEGGKEGEKRAGEESPLPWSAGNSLPVREGHSLPRSP